MIFLARHQVGVLLGGDQNITKSQMQAVIDFETRLANITTPSDLRRDEESLYNLMTIKELQAKTGFVCKLFKFKRRDDNRRRRSLADRLEEVL